MRDHSLMDRLHYKFDNYMSKGTAAMIGGLAVLSLIVIVVAATVITLGGIRPGGEGEALNFWEAGWEALMRTLDAGTMGGDTGWGFRLVMFAVTLGGVFVISALIGILTSGLEGKMEELRKGRSRVIESGHTVILGWSPQVFSIISELVVANENQANSCVVVLGPEDKVVMEDAIQANLESTGKTQVVVRSGNPIDPNDLTRVSLATAKSIIILSPEKNNPDADVIKTILAITNGTGRKTDPYHIVAEIKDPKNFEVAQMVGKDEVELVLANDLIARIIAQTCRQSGLSVVYTELLDFGGDEIYFKEEPSLLGKTFGETLLAYEDSAVMGIFDSKRNAHLNPPMDTRLNPGDQLIVISEDDDTVRMSGRTDYGIQADRIVMRPPAHPSQERTIVLGWNSLVPKIISELDNYVAPGSAVLVVDDQTEMQAKIERLCPDLKNQTVVCRPDDTTDRRVLDSLNVEEYQHVIVLADDSAADPQEADARTLITLLHLRDIASKVGRNFAMVSEMLDVRNRALAEVTHADDFIVSDRLISLMMTQISENKYLNPVFKDLFDPEGSEVYLKLASEYVQIDVPVNFYTVVEAASRRGEVALGYRLKALVDDASQSYGVVVNPEKSKLITFAERDRIILLAEC